MAELFTQLSVISALLGGFAFTFVAALLVHPTESRAYVWAFGSSLFSATGFLVAALGSVLASVAVKNSFPINFQSYQQTTSVFFLLGLLGFILTTGACGWLKSRRLGYLSSSIALVCVIGIAKVLLPFLSFD